MIAPYGRAFWTGKKRRVAVEVDEMIRKINQARSLVREVMTQANIPQIERCMQLADMNLHWAKWNLGDIDEIMPELES